MRLPDPALHILRAFASAHTFGPYVGQEALARRLGYRHRESITPWWRGLDTGRTEGRTTPPAPARMRLWAVMLAHEPGMARAVAAVSPALRREIRAVEAMMAAGAYADAAGEGGLAPVPRGRPAARLAHAA